MEPVSPFQSALSDFTYEAASGGAVRQWTDLGYTVKQIMEKLDFPTPFPWVQKQVWERLTQTGAILLEEPGSPRQTQDFVWECDQYGRRSFRRIIKPVEGERPICWKEVSVGSLLSLHPFLREEIKENGRS